VDTLYVDRLKIVIVFSGKCCSNYYGDDEKALSGVCHAVSCMWRLKDSDVCFYYRRYRSI
jgi:hypothetical protein